MGREEEQATAARRRKDEVKGKIVYYNYAFNPTNVQTFVSYGDAGIYRYAGPSRAAKYGAAGVMIRSLTSSTANDPHTGAMKYNDSFPKIPAIAIGPRDRGLPVGAGKAIGIESEHDYERTFPAGYHWS